MSKRDTSQDSRESGVDDMVRSAFTDPPPAEVRARLRPQFEALRARLTPDDDARLPRRWRSWHPLRIAAALLIAVVAFAAGSMAVNIAPRPTWADVVDQFGSVSGLQANVYVEEHAGADPVHVELWMARGGLTRMRAGHEVAFGRQGWILDSVMLEDAPLSPSVKHARDMVRDFAGALGTADAFSLETLLDVLPGSFSDIEVLETQASTPSQDLLVFDMAGEEESGRIRIWALRRSRLPVRMLYWDPDTGKRVDVSLSYTDPQPSAFFDPSLFRYLVSEMEDDANKAKAAYLLLDQSERGGSPGQDKVMAP
ncbi:MAG: hypothetical protein ACLFV4_03775 [Candidatus Hydrogenedentota bacterium]